MPPRGRSRTPRSSAKPKPRIYVKTRYSNSRTSSRNRAATIIQKAFVKQYVKKQLDKAIENKNTNEKTHDQHCHHINILQQVTPWYYSLDSDWNMVQGAEQYRRIGNSITLKKHRIRFQIYPSSIEAPIAAGGESGTRFNQFTYQGTFTVALVKMRNGSTVPTGLTSLLQNGNTTITPLGKVFDNMYSINYDTYKIYWKKAYKMGPSAPAYFNSDTDRIPGFMQFNNDYKLTRYDEIELTDHVGKNAKITYNDNGTNAIIPAYMTGLALIGWWTPIAKDILYDNGNSSFYSMRMTTYTEYEDA